MVKRLLNESRKIRVVLLWCVNERKAKRVEYWSPRPRRKRFTSVLKSMERFWRTCTHLPVRWGNTNGPWYFLWRGNATFYKCRFKKKNSRLLENRVTFFFCVRICELFSVEDVVMKRFQIIQRDNASATMSVKSKDNVTLHECHTMNNEVSNRCKDTVKYAHVLHSNAYRAVDLNLFHFKAHPLSTTIFEMPIYPPHYFYPIFRSWHNLKDVYNL